MRYVSCKINNETKDGGEGKTSDESKEGGGSGVAEGKSGEGGGSGPASPAAAFDPTSMQGGDDVPVRLSIDTTPEFMQLPLEFQGYCPHTIVTRNALLLPGNPALGVVRYKNTFNVFVTVQAMEDFMSDPGRFIGGVIDIARKNPELIHLLRLQNNFPAVSHLLSSCFKTHVESLFIDLFFFCCCCCCCDCCCCCCFATGITEYVGPKQKITSTR